MSSTKGYLKEIGFLQYLHFPFKIKKLIKGISSKGLSGVEQFGQ